MPVYEETDCSQEKIFPDILLLSVNCDTTAVLQYWQTWNHPENKIDGWKSERHELCLACLRYYNS